MRTEGFELQRGKAQVYAAPTYGNEERFLWTSIPCVITTSNPLQDVTALNMPQSVAEDLVDVLLAALDRIEAETEE